MSEIMVVGLILIIGSALAWIVGFVMLPHRNWEDEQ